MALTQNNWASNKKNEYDRLVKLAKDINVEVAKEFQKVISELKNEKKHKGNLSDKKEKKLNDFERSLTNHNNGNTILMDLPELWNFSKDAKFFAVSGVNPSLPGSSIPNIFDHFPKSMNFHLRGNIDKFKQSKYFPVFYEFAWENSFFPIWFNTSEFDRRVNNNSKNLNPVQLSSIKSFRHWVSNQKTKSNYLVFVDPISFAHTTNSDITEIYQKLNFKTQKLIEEFYQLQFDYLNPEITLVANASTCNTFFDMDNDENKDKFLIKYNKRHWCVMSGMLTGGSPLAKGNRAMLFQYLSNFLK